MKNGILKMLVVGIIAEMRRRSFAGGQQGKGKCLLKF